MCNGCSEGVSRIVWFYNLFHIEVYAHGFLHIFFTGTTIACHGHFDLKRRVFIDWQLTLARNKDTNPTRFGNRDTGRNVLIKEYQKKLEEM